ncbi:MAG TPA: hypothetical protein ENJ82_08210 [Bacteroidetes bacterium]|nr:hypothetical protein [Bacteroidota bacterium]
MRHIILLAFIALLGPLPLSAQSQVLPQGRTFSFSYYGDFLLHPGLKISYEHPLWVKEKVGKRSKMPKAHLVFAVADASFYVHPGTLTALQLGGGAGYRKVGKKGSFFDFQMALWLTHHINAGKTISITDGQASNVSFLAGRRYLMPSFAMTFGRSLYPKKKIPLSWFVRPRFGLILPYNSGASILAPALETGISWTFPSSTSNH